MNRQKPIGAIGTLALAIMVSACGGQAYPTTASPATGGTAAASPAAAPASARASARGRLRILTPGPGARVDQTVTIRVGLAGGPRRRLRRIRFRLDGGRPRPGSARFVLRDLRPGRHRLLVTLAGDPAVRATRVFVVRTAPPTPATSAPAPTSSAAPPSTSPAAPTPSAAPASSSTASTNSSAAPTSSAAAPTSSAPAPGGIPQGNGGDGDSDNNGGPSDGDGNL